MTQFSSTTFLVSHHGTSVPLGRIDTMLSRAQRDRILADVMAVLGRKASLPPPAAAARKLRQSPPDGLILRPVLRTAAQAAARLGCSTKTLNAHVASGDLRYVSIGKGTKRPRKMFTDADLDEFIANQTRKEPPCLSDATRGRRSGSTTSRSEIIAFSEVQKRRRNATPKK